MKYKKILVLISLTFLSCNKPTIFVLKDNDVHSRYSLSDSVKIAFKNDAVNKTPLVAIDGIVWKYNKKLDTVILPLGKSDIRALQIVHKNSSSVIYGKGAVDGAIIINTIHLK
jgi:hypothetical protein